MNFSSALSRFVTSGILFLRFSFTSSLCTFRSLRNLCRAKNHYQQRISLYRISNGSRFYVRSRTNRRRLSLINHHILHFIRSSSHVIRHPPTRRNWKNSLSRIILRMFLRLNPKGRILRNIVRELRMQIRFILRLTKRRSWFLANLCYQATWSSLTSFFIFGYFGNRNCNSRYLAYSNETHNGSRIIFFRYFSWTLLIFHTNSSQFTIRPIGSRILLFNSRQNFTFSSIRCSVFTRQIRFLAVFFCLTGFLRGRLQFIFISCRFRRVSPYRGTWLKRRYLSRLRISVICSMRCGQICTLGGVGSFGRSVYFDFTFITDFLPLSFERAGLMVFFVWEWVIKRFIISSQELFRRFLRIPSFLTTVPGNVSFSWFINGHMGRLMVFFSSGKAGFAVVSFRWQFSETHLQGGTWEFNEVRWSIMWASDYNLTFFAMRSMSIIGWNGNLEWPLCCCSRDKCHLHGSSIIVPGPFLSSSLSFFGASFGSSDIVYTKWHISFFSITVLVGFLVYIGDFASSVIFDYSVDSDFGSGTSVRLAV